MHKSATHVQLVNLVLWTIATQIGPVWLSSEGRCSVLDISLKSLPGVECSSETLTAVLSSPYPSGSSVVRSWSCWPCAEEEDLSGGPRRRLRVFRATRRNPCRGGRGRRKPSKAGGGREHCQQTWVRRHPWKNSGQEMITRKIRGTTYGAGSQGPYSTDFRIM